MKRLLIVLALIAFPCISLAADLTLATPEKVSPQEYNKIKLGSFEVNFDEQTITYHYQLIAADGQAVPKKDGTTSRTFVCFERAEQIAANCTENGVPYNGCTGAGTGENLLPAVTCFSEVYNRDPKEVGAGKNVGGAFRETLIKKVTSSILSAGNTATE